MNNLEKKVLFLNKLSAWLDKVYILDLHNLKNVLEFNDKAHEMLAFSLLTFAYTGRCHYVVFTSDHMVK